MSQPSTEQTPAGQASAPSNANPPATDRGKRWRDGEFDEERATRLIANLEQQVETLREKATKHDEAERAKLGDVERLTAELKEATDGRSKAEVKLAKITAGVNAGLSIAQSQRLSGEKPEDFEADAKAFAEELGIKTPGAPAADAEAETEESSGKKDISNHRSSAPTQQPADATPRGGRAAEAEPDEDLRKILDEIPR